MGSWWNPLTHIDNATGGHLGDAVRYGKNKVGDALEWYDQATDRDQGKNMEKLQDQGGKASGFADQTQGSFTSLGDEANRERDYLRDIARNGDPATRLFLKQGMQRNQAMQQSMAAGARPGNSAMAAINAASNAGRAGAALAGQQAAADLQARKQAQMALAQMLMQQRQQDLSAALGSRGDAIGAYGTAYTGSMQTPTSTEKAMQLAMNLGQWAGFGG